MKQLLALMLVLGASTTFAATLRGQLNWHNGKYSCSAYNDSGSSIYVRGVMFYGEDNSNRNKQRWVRIGRSVPHNTGITTTPTYVQPVTSVESCVFFYDAR